MNFEVPDSYCFYSITVYLTIKTVSKNQRLIVDMNFYKIGGGRHWLKSLWMAVAPAFDIGFEKPIDQPIRQLWRKDGCETEEKTETHEDKVKAGRMSRPFKDEQSISTWKNEPAYVSDLLQLQWCRWNSRDPGVLCYRTGDVSSPGLGFLESTGGNSMVAGTSVPLLLLHTTR